MKYGEIIRRAVQITWRNKVLWLFGIALALFGGMRGGGGGTGWQFSFGSADVERWARRMPFYWPGTSVDWGAVAAGALAIAGLIALLALVWAIVGIIVRYTSMGALIGMAAEIQAGEQTSFGAGVRRGWGRLLRLFAIGLIIGIVAALIALVIVLAFLALGVIVVAPAVAMFASGGGWIALGVAWIVLLGVAWLGLAILVAIVVGGAFSVVREYAFRGAVLQERGVFDAIGAGITLLRTRIRQSAAMWLLLAAIQLGLGLVLLPFLVVVAAGAGMSVAALAMAARSALPALLIGAPLALLGGLFMLLIGGIYTAFQSVAWTLFYLELEPQAEV